MGKLPIRNLEGLRVTLTETRKPYGAWMLEATVPAPTTSAISRLYVQVGECVDLPSRSLRRTSGSAFPIASPREGPNVGCPLLFAVFSDAGESVTCATLPRFR